MIRRKIKLYNYTNIISIYFTNKRNHYKYNEQIYTNLNNIRKSTNINILLD